MQTPLTLMHMGLFVIVAMTVWEVVKLTLQRFFKKAVDTEYVTVAKCRQCREDCQSGRRSKDLTIDEKLEKIGSTLDSFREVLFEIAMKDGIPAEKVKPLLNRG